jgi:MYXO-CTERM domain-containing protein
VVIGKAKIAEAPARYRVEIDRNTSPTLPVQPERVPYEAPAPLEVGPRWYAGDLHVHSLESGDADASLDGVATAAEAAGLDFVVISDHNTVSHLDFLNAVQARHPTVLLVPGTEFTTYDGHANAFGVSAWVDHRIGQPGATIEAAFAAYEAQGAVTSLNHPTMQLGDRCIGCAWEHQIPDEVVGIELGSGGWDPVGRLFTPTAITLWESLADEGRLLVPLGGSDDHHGAMGSGAFDSPIGSATTLVWADALSVEGLLDGLRAGRTVVKLQDGDDPMVELSVDAGWATASVTGGGDSLVWWVDGDEVRTTAIEGDALTDTLAVAAGSRVRVVVQVGSSPRTLSHFVVAGGEPPPPDGDAGCGCAARPSPWGPWWLALVAAPWSRRRRPS